MPSYVGKLFASPPFMSIGRAIPQGMSKPHEWMDLRVITMVLDVSDGWVKTIHVNKPISLKVADTVDDKDFPVDRQVYFGGAQEIDKICYAYRVRNDFEVDGAIHLGDDLYYSGDFSEIIMGLKFNLIEDIQFFSGYSLIPIEELEKNWIFLEIDLCLNGMMESDWKNSLFDMGGSYAPLSEMDPFLAVR
jgi:hypothetical protein